MGRIPSTAPPTTHRDQADSLAAEKKPARGKKPAPLDPQRLGARSMRQFHLPFVTWSTEELSDSVDPQSGAEQLATQLNLVMGALSLSGSRLPPMVLDGADVRAVARRLDENDARAVARAPHKASVEQPTDPPAYEEPPIRLRAQVMAVPGDVRRSWARTSFPARPGDAFLDRVTAGVAVDEEGQLLPDDRPAIERGLGEGILPVLFDSLDDASGAPWDAAVREHVLRLAAEGLFGERVVAVGLWRWGDGTDQSDIVALATQHTPVLIEEVEWRRGIDGG